MDKYKLKFTRLQEEIIRFLMKKTGEEFSLREIAKALKVSPTAISKAIKPLKKLITIKPSAMNISLTQINRNNPYIIQLKKIQNQKEILESNLINILKETFPGTTIILFGSYARGEDTINSDIDLAILGKEKIINLQEQEEYLERKINIQFYKNLDEIHKHLKENIYNGIILAGGIQL